MATGKIAWIGAGKMGLPICKRLKAAGYDVSVLARRAEQQQVLEGLGFRVSTDVPTLVREADIVFTCVSDDAALAEVMLNDGFNAALQSGATCIDMSTVSPSISAEIAARLPTSAAFLRAPVSGSTGMAEAGTLTALVSGPRQAFDAMAPVLSAYTKKAFHLGEGEEARYLKLAVNSMVAATAALVGEALAFGLKGRLTHHAMLDVISQSAVASPLIGYKAAMITSGDYAPAATLNMLKKDLDLFLDEGAKAGMAMPLGSAIGQVYEAAVHKGLGEKDFFVLVQEAEEASRAKART